MAFSAFGGVFWLHSSRAATAGIFLYCFALNNLTLTAVRRKKKPDGAKRILRCLVSFGKTGLLAHEDGDDGDERFVHVHIDYFNV